MEFPREVYALLDHWRRFPPAHLAVARLERVVCAALGIEMPDRPSADQHAPAPVSSYSDSSDPFDSTNAWAKRENARRSQADEDAVRAFVSQATGG